MHHAPFVPEEPEEDLGVFIAGNSAAAAAAEQPSSALVVQHLLAVFQNAPEMVAELTAEYQQHHAPELVKEPQLPVAQFG